MPSKVVIKAAGLSTSPNLLIDSDGVMDVASNIIIRRQDIIEPRRGFYLYGEQIGSSSDRVTELFSYKTRLLGHYGDTLFFQDGVDNLGVIQYTNFNGTYSQTQEGLRIKGIEANGNFYFTTADGVKKISAASASDLTGDAGYITDAGGVKALDVEARLAITPGDISGFLPSDNAVAYRIVWGIRDLNNNLILGTPSQRAEVYNPLLNLDLRDYERLLSALDNIDQTGSMVDDGDYVSTLSLPISASAEELRNNLVALSAKIDNDILYANDTGSGAPLNISTVTVSNGVVTVNFSAGDATDYFIPGSKIFLVGFESSSVPIEFLNTAQTVTSVASGSITFTPENYISVVEPSGLSGSITAVAVSNPAIINSANHGLVTGQTINIAGTNTTASINGNQIVTVLSNDTFSVPVNVTIVTSAYGTWDLVVGTNGEIFSNEYRSITESIISPETEPFDTFTIATPATNNNVKAIQNCIAAIIARLDAEPEDVISTALKNAYFTDLAVTETANVLLTITVPENITPSYFYQIYRTKNFPAGGVTSISDIVPNDELQLAYEAFPTEAEIAAREVVVLDITPEGFLGANLYTNPSTGEGITQANDLPPFCKDINTFKSTVFYANTKTRHRKNLNLIGVSQMIEDYDDGITPRVVISDGTNTIALSFVTGTQEITDILLTDEASFTGGTRRYFDIYSAMDETAYRVVYESSTMTVDPDLTGKTPIRVILAGSETASEVAEKTRDKFNVYGFDFLAEDNTLPTIRIYTTGTGYTTDADIGTLPVGATVTVFQQGRGEDVANQQVLLSTNASPSIAVDETARSFVKVINKTTSSPVVAFYLSGAQDVPGKMFLESKDLNTSAFAIVANNENTGSSFNPDISPTVTMQEIDSSDPALITTTTNHGLLNQDRVLVLSDSIPLVNGIFTATVTGLDTFTIPVDGDPGDATPQVGSIIKYSDAELSENEEKKNRIYYSKFQQPESVPIVNYLTVGAEDKAILRIFPLRDSLFVFKEDGLFRISGETAPFVSQLFDSSCICNAPDSLGVMNNLIFIWTTQGISSVSESGVNIMTREIDDQILRIQSFDNFSTATHGVGYESDNEYIVWTTERDIDTTGTIGYRYNNLTNSWVTLDRNATSSIINPVDNRLYFGAGDTNFIERERKDFDRTDYADREVSSPIDEGKYINGDLTLATVSGVRIGDVVVQVQTLTVPLFNGLLNKLDLDPGTDEKDYFTTLEAEMGDNMRTNLLALAAKLDTDPGVNDTNYVELIEAKAGTITSNSVDIETVVTTSAPHELVDGRIVSIAGNTGSIPTINGQYAVTVISPTTFSIPVNVTTSGSGGTFNSVTEVTNASSFADLKACYNAVIDKLNLDIGISFSNYQQIVNDTEYEAIITSINTVQKNVLLNNNVDFIVGPLTLYKAIHSTFTYSAITMGDALNFKQIRESTMMFDGKNFTSAKVSFATDLLPEFIDVPFNADGNGIFGYTGIYPLARTGFGGGFFGGAANNAPFRTYIPRQCQRCRYMLIKFLHEIARENYRILGTSLTGEIYGERAYR